MQAPPVAEWTLRAAATGIVLGLVFGAANAYLGLRVGLTITASIPAAVMTVAIFRLAGVRGSILEANLSQTIGSASTSLASGTIFTIPALFLWGAAPPYLQVVALCFLGGVLGLSAMIPLRRLLVVGEHANLPYPEGTACAEVLRATTAEHPAGGRWIFYGMAVGAAVKLAVSLAFLVPGDLSVALPVLPRAQLAIELAPALLAVGYILGYRQSAVLVAGALVSSLVLIPLISFFGSGLSRPLYPETTKLVAQMSAGELWSRYVRYIGAGAVAVAGIVTVVRNLPTMTSAFTAVVKGMRTTREEAGAGAAPVAGRVANPEADRDLPGSFVVAGIAAVVLACAFVPGIFSGPLSPVQRLVCAAGVGIFGLLFVAVAARIVGIVGVTSQPTSGIALVTLLGTATVFAASGWTSLSDRAAVLTVGTVVAIAASKAGDISQDLKTGWLVGATPLRQQLGQLLGAAFACWAVAATVLLLGSAYTFGSRELPAPQATLMKTIVEGVLAGALPWGLVLTGGGLAIAAILCGVSGLAFAIGVYLPLSSMMPIFVGGCVRALADRGAVPVREGEADGGILAASGLVAGEGLAGILVAALIALRAVPRSIPPRLAGGVGEAGTLLAVGLLCLFLARARRQRS
ncbi:MAG: OPT family oligopeptide transporter [Myxococcales bacterium]